jgi:hypothetical protein
MKRIIKQFENLTEEQLYTLSAVLDDCLDQLAERHKKRGYQRSTYICDLVRGKRRAPRKLRRAA